MIVRITEPLIVDEGLLAKFSNIRLMKSVLKRVYVYPV